MRHLTRHHATLRLLGVLLCVCLVAQPLLVPLHLLVEDHTYGPVVAELHAPSHGHSHHGHSHGHSHSHAHAHPHTPAPAESPDDDPHPAHPAEDHYCCAASLPQTPPPNNANALALAPHVAATGDLRAVTPWRPSAYRAPERPPPRSAASQRAPPAVV